MSTQPATHGLNCPQCGGIVPIPEGQLIVRCPYCDLRSFVKGERGILRYQTPQSISRDSAVSAMRRFLSSNWAIARDATSRAQLSEAFLAYLPFWVVWGRAMGWVFGEKKIRSGDSTRYEPREVRTIEGVTWNGAACDVGEFGVNQVPLDTHAFQPFEPEVLHAQGLVFEPVGSFTEAEKAAGADFEESIRKQGRLDRISQVFIRFFRRRYGLAYYPLWVLRYLYRGRSFQVVVDGSSGKVLYGKGPGNTLYRALVLVAGMAFGAFLSIDIAALLLYLGGSSDDGEGILGVAAVAFFGGIGLMYWAYRSFRYGEEFEYRHGAPGLTSEMFSVKSMESKIEEMETWVNRLS